MHGIISKFRPANRPRPTASGFTLVEIMIVVVILGILAAIVIPQFSNASETARENTLKDELRYLRTQIVVYSAQHLDVPPGYPSDKPGTTPTQAAFLSEMTTYTDCYGTTSPTSTFSDTYQYGPYLTQMPMNPVNSLNSVLFVADGASVPAADGAYGFIYQPQSKTIIPDVVGNDSAGVPYSSY